MLKLDKEHLLFFQNLIGSSFATCSSKGLRIYGRNLNGYSYTFDYILAVTFNKHNKQQRVVFKGMLEDFFETKLGDEVYHDYSIEYEVDTSKSEEIQFETSPITEILIYGKPFNIEEFKRHSDIYNKHKHIDKTDEVFLFKCENGEHITILFFDSAPGIVLATSEYDEALEQSYIPHEFPIPNHHFKL